MEHSLRRAVTALLSHGSDVNYKNKHGLSPLHVALQVHGSRSTTAAAVAAAAAAPFTVAAATAVSHADEIVHCLVKSGYNTDINLPDDRGRSHYHFKES